MARPWSTSVRLRLAADSRSTVALSSADPNAQSPSTSSCSASVRARVALAPVAYNLDDGHYVFGQKVLAALDKDGATAALAEFTKAEDEDRKKENDADKGGKS